MVTDEDVIKFYKQLYPEGPYNVRLMTVDGEVAIHDLTYHVEEIVENYNLLAAENLHWYISVNKHTRENGRIKKTGEIDKIVIDFDSDNPDETIQEARKVQRHFNLMGYDTLAFTSGRKGIHVHVRVNHMKNVDQGIRMYFEDTVEMYDLKTLDMKVISDQSARITRIPGTIHPKGGPVMMVDLESGDTIEELEELSIKDAVFRPLDIGEVESKVQSLQEKYNKKIEEYNKPKEGVYLGGWTKQHNSTKIMNWNVMDKVFPQLYETGKHVSGSKHIVKCPFHNDNSPSAFYNDKLFHCSACDISVGTYNLLVNHAGLSKEKALEMIRKYQ